VSAGKRRHRVLLLILVALACDGALVLLAKALTR